MMLLGLVLHAAVSYLSQPTPAWFYHDRMTSPICDGVVMLIHSFRMPVFFVMAGFFTSLLYERRGLGGMLRNRRDRILVPFIVAWVILQPLVIYGFQFAGMRGGYELPAAIRNRVNFEPYLNFSTMHLWFLYYLIFFYVISAALVRILHGSHLARLATTAVRWIVRAPAGPAILAIPTSLSLYFMAAGQLETSTSILPSIKVLLAYFVFFSFGWLLYKARDQISALSASTWRNTILGLLLFPLHFLVVVRIITASEQSSSSLQTLAAASNGLMIWLLIFGITGLFLRYCDRPMPRMRYITDASYWIYLVHLPLVVWLAGALAPYSIPALAKVTIILAVSTPILLASYRFGVRGTVIGLWLNGKRIEPSPRTTALPGP